ncbi:MAG: helix-turn-helix transcriptional regulator [Bacteroidales bacterium]|nr:helix-turn-helix transcriptional regulator [Bacteroidales bacterium]
MNNRLNEEEIKKLRTLDFSRQKGFVDAETVLTPAVGEPGSESRNAFNAKAQAWYYGEILRDRRKDLKMTQKQLADRIGKERTYISRIEKGETDMQLSSFLQIAEALNLRVRMEAVLV